MTHRVLPRTEYPKLAGTELETVWPVLPEDALVLVVEDGAEIVACWALLTVRHVEGLWIAPAHRGKGSVARRLLAGMRTLVGVRPVVTAAMTDEIRGLLDRIAAQKLPGDHYVMTLGGEPCQQPSPFR